MSVVLCICKHAPVSEDRLLEIRYGMHEEKGVTRQHIYTPIYLGMTTCHHFNQVFSCLTGLCTVLYSLRFERFAAPDIFALACSLTQPSAAPPSTRRSPNLLMRQTMRAVTDLQLITRLDSSHNLAQHFSPTISWPRQVFSLGW